MTSVIAEASTVTPLPEDQRPFAADRLVSTPLPQLLAEHDAIMVESKITDPTFIGNAVVCRDGQIVLSMPTGRSEYEHDTTARYLLATALDLPCAPLPPQFAVTTFRGRV